jgi:hypothetical protein
MMLPSSRDGLLPRAADLAASGKLVLALLQRPPQVRYRGCPSEPPGRIPVEAAGQA